MLKIHNPLKRDPFTVQEIREILEAESELSEVQKKVNELRRTISEKAPPSPAPKFFFLLSSSSESADDVQNEDHQLAPELITELE